MAEKSLVAGIGCRRGASADDIIDLIETTLAMAGRSITDLGAIATIERKADEPGLNAAAVALGVPLRVFSAAELSTSDHPNGDILRLIGVPAVAEASAAMAGPLLVRKQKSARVTCALSLCSPGFFGQSASAAIAASTLLTSSAGP